MNYLVIEIQTNDNVMSTLSYQFDNLVSAEQKFYQILSIAVASNVDCHSALIVDENGFVIKNESFRHSQ